MLRFMGNWLRGRRPVIVAVGCMLPLLAGCGSGAKSGQRTTGSGAATSYAPAGAVREAQQYLHGWSCSAMSLTSPTAIADDVAANADGNQFGSGSGPSAQADFLPASGKANGQPYAEFECTKVNRRAVLWVNEIGGVWTSMNGGLTAPAALSETPTRISISASSRSNPTQIENALQQNLSNAFASSSASVRPACSLSDKQKNDYFCVVTNSSTSASAMVLYQVDTASGTVVSLSAGKTSAGAQTSGTSTASGGSDADSYQACSDTVASAKSMTTNLRTYVRNQSNVSEMHDDFEALGLDLGLLSRQVESAGQYSNGVALESAGAAYLADAEEVDISGQLESPPDEFGAALRGSCPHSFAAADLTAGGSSSGGTTGSSATTTGSMVCEDKKAPGVKVTADKTTCAKADALLVALPDNPLGHQSVQGWACDTPTSGGLTTCTLGATSVTFLPDPSGPTASGYVGETRCPGSVTNNTGSYVATGQGWFDGIRISGGPCSQAIEVIQAFGAATNWVLDSYRDFGLSVGAMRFACGDVIGEPSGDPGNDHDLEAQFTCTAGGETVNWVAPPGD
jgi:hypothetical protein